MFKKKIKNKTKTNQFNPSSKKDILFEMSLCCRHGAGGVRCDGFPEQGARSGDPDGWALSSCQWKDAPGKNGDS